MLDDQREFSSLPFTASSCSERHTRLHKIFISRGLGIADDFLVLSLAVLARYCAACELISVMDE